MTWKGDDYAFQKLDDLHAELAEQRTHQREIFHRLNFLEKRMAQGVILAIVASLIAPVILGVVVTAAISAQ